MNLSIARRKDTGSIYYVVDSQTKIYEKLIEDGFDLDDIAVSVLNADIDIPKICLKDFYGETLYYVYEEYSRTPITIFSSEKEARESINNMNPNFDYKVGLIRLGVNHGI